MRSFSSRRQREVVSIVDEAEVSRLYVLVELVGTERDAYLNNLGKRVDKDRRISDFDGLEGQLVWRSLHTGPEGADEDALLAMPLDNLKKTELKFVQGLPASTLKALFNICNVQSGMEEAALAAAKNA
jgi:hypothetical protein